VYSKLHTLFSIKPKIRTHRLLPPPSLDRLTLNMGRPTNHIRDFAICFSKLFSPFFSFFSLFAGLLACLRIIRMFSVETYRFEFSATHPKEYSPNLESISFSERWFKQVKSKCKKGNKARLRKKNRKIEIIKGKYGTRRRRYPCPCPCPRPCLWPL